MTDVLRIAGITISLETISAAARILDKNHYTEVWMRGDHAECQAFYNDVLRCALAVAMIVNKSVGVPHGKP